MIGQLSGLGQSKNIALATASATAKNFIGAGYPTRTDGLSLTRRLLYQLS
jgi:hypothetical protein